VSEESRNSRTVANRADARRSGRSLRSERGVAMVEFALIAPVLLLILAGMLGFGRVLFYWIDANHLANEAARWAVVDRNPYAPATLQEYIRDSGTQEFAGDVRVCIDFPNGGTPQIGDPVRVRVQKPFSFVPIVNMFDVTVKASATQRIERLANGVSPASYAAGDVGGACT
jgi:Flp pilus assembly pilin Flp